MLAFAPFMLGACAGSGGLLGTVGDDYAAPQARTGSAWRHHSGKADSGAPQLAHDGRAARLENWWAQFGDPVLLELQQAAQRVSPTLAQAAARIEQARAQLTNSEAQGRPAAQASANALRSASRLEEPKYGYHYQSLYGHLQSSWEIDLFGGIARQRESAAARLSADAAHWHDARVSLAADVALGYVQYRDCEARTSILQKDTASREASARIAERAGRIGLQAESDIALARASAAEGASQLTQHRSDCARLLLGLSVLTGIDILTLEQRLTQAPSTPGVLPTPPGFAIPWVPAQVLLQRPDIRAAERELAMAHANIGVQQAQRYPRLTLLGHITPVRTMVNPSPTLVLRTWSLGPALSLPVLDGGRAAAATGAARAQYEAAASLYQHKVRQAVREVEEALLRLQTVTDRRNDVQVAARNYQLTFELAEARKRIGIGAQHEIELARRQALHSEAAMQSLALEQVGAWIALYRATGGGWSIDTPTPPLNRNRNTEAKAVHAH